MLKFITIGIIITNMLLLNDDVPVNIMGITFASLILSLFITHQTVRTTIKIILLALSMLLLRLHFKTLLVTECGVSFVLILSALKFWELNEERDHFNMFLILCLAECSVFLLNPTFLVFAFGIVKMMFYFYYILKMRNYDISLLNPKRLILLAAPSIALSLLLFYTFPRFTQGFINTSDMQYIISGASSRFDFKQLGPISLSSEQAFKAYGLEDSKLPFKILYWRTAVLWQLSGQEWSAANSNLKKPEQTLINAPLKYRVEVFDRFKEYLPVLDGTANVESANLPFVSYSDGSFKLRTISRGELTYIATGNYQTRIQDASPLMLRKGLRLKSPRKDEVYKSYFKAEEKQLTDEEKLKDLINIFKNRGFQYSTTPESYASVEDFLLKGSNGYCSHFSAAFVYLARLRELPARIVTGYLGGEFNPYDNSVIVKELDAHAWVEVYLAEKGWVKVDPTSFVAPERITMSTEEFNKKLNPYITIFNIKIDRSLFDSATMNNLALWLDSLNSRFNTKIFNFDRDSQLAVLRALTPGNLPVGFIFAFTLILFLLIFWLIFYLYGKKRLHPAQKRYLRFLRKMQSYGLHKDECETISMFKERCLAHIPEQSQFISNEVNLYITAFYK